MQELRQLTPRIATLDEVPVKYCWRLRVDEKSLLSEAGETSMRKFTESLIDQAISLGGTFYLPYRLHYNEQQLKVAYPMLDEFIEIKKVADPKQIFSNMLWDKITNY